MSKRKQDGGMLTSWLENAPAPLFAAYAISRYRFRGRGGGIPRPLVGYLRPNRNSMFEPSARVIR